MGCIWVFPSAVRQGGVCMGVSKCCDMGGVCMGVSKCCETGWGVYVCFQLL